MPTCRECSSSFPNRVEIEGVFHVINHRNYCLKCLPFGMKKRKPYKLDKKEQKEKVCSDCKIMKPIKEFYQYKAKDRPGVKTYGYCRECQQTRSRERRRGFKEKCVEYKGGICEECGYSKCVAALSFHHLDSSKKEFQISDTRYKKWEIVKDELDKCELLCNNCHAEKHFYMIK